MQLILIRFDFFSFKLLNKFRESKQKRIEEEEEKNMGTNLFGVPVKIERVYLKTNKINACNQIEFNQFY